MSSDHGLDSRLRGNDALGIFKADQYANDHLNPAEDVETSQRPNVRGRIRRGVAHGRNGTNPRGTHGL